VSAESRPAFSEPFAPDAVADVSVALPMLVTRDWAWADSTGRGVRVAVIDSGVDPSHPAIDGRVSAYCAVTMDGDKPVFDLAPHRDVFGHGTACAGIILSLAPEAEIVSVRVLGENLKGTGAAFAAGVRWSIDQGFKVANLSLGTTRREFLVLFHELADTAWFSDLALVTAANNWPTPSFPSMFPSVISVASHGEEDPLRFYVNPHPPVDFGAHGVNVRVPWKGGGWATMTGNSFAAPHMTGLVTLIRGKHPDLTPLQVKALLQALATNARTP
jgi:subtilisin family serine protease